MLSNMYIKKILCKYKEYRLRNGRWVITADSVFDSDIDFIMNIVNSSSYFANLGGYMNIDYRNNKRFGLVPSKIVCVSICKTIKKVFVFNYNQAQV